MRISQLSKMNLRTVITCIFAAVAVVACGRLLLTESGTMSAGVIAGMSLFGLLVIYFGDRIDSFDFKAMKVKLQQVEAAKREVENIAVALAEISIFFAAFNHRLGNEETHRIERDWITGKVHQLLESMGTDPSRTAGVMRYLKAIEEIDAARGCDRKSGADEWVELWRRIALEVKSRS